MAEEPEEESHIPACPLCGTREFVKKLLFYTYCANPAHSHKPGESQINTVLEFNYCIVHGKKDDCVPVMGGVDVGGESAP